MDKNKTKNDKTIHHFIVLIITLLFMGTANANPVLNNVASGNVVIQQSPGNTQIQQNSQQAIINWRSFNINTGEKTHFQQPTGGVALNRIDPTQGVSKIYGTLTATGKIILVNQAGIYFGPTALVDVGGIIASTSDISDRNFLAGRYIFDSPSPYRGSIVNAGTIRAENYGLVALVGSGVNNQGMIQANRGSVVLASGNKFTVDLSGDRLINFTVDEQSEGAIGPTGEALRNGVSNTGIIIADGGTILMTARAAQGVLDNVINMEGVAQAKAVTEKNGEIILWGDQDGVIRVAGKIDSSGKESAQTGGIVKIVGKQILIDKGSEIDVSGDADGGEILIGGNYQGKTPLTIFNRQVSNAIAAVIKPETVLNANALTKGNGGKIIVWADDLTKSYGTILARGGNLSGKGGFVETSGKNYLDVTNSSIDVRGKNGVGTWLLDPRNVTISVAGTANGSFDNGSPTNTFTPNANDAIINTTTLTSNLGTANVTITTGSTGGQAGDITVSDPITWSTSNTLTLQAANNIYINAAIIGTNGGLTLSAVNAPASIQPGSSGSISVANFILSQGQWSQNMLGLGSLPSFSATNDFQLNSNTKFLRVTDGNGSGGSPYLISDVYGLQGIESVSTSSSYQLVSDIDASVTANWNSGAGFVPIGTSSAFTGTLSGGSADGEKYVIRNLTIYRPTTDNQGLISQLDSGGIVQYIGLINPDVTGQASVGALVGNAAANGASSILNSYVDGGSVYGFSYVGGLLGAAQTSSASAALTIQNTYSSATVQGNGAVGGLIGILNLSDSGASASISDSYTIGTTSSYDAGSNAAVGGFIGQICGGPCDASITINRIYSTGTVSTASPSVYDGALLGYNGGGTGTTWSDAYWDGETSGMHGTNASDSFPLTSGVTNFETAPLNPLSLSSYSGWDFSTSGPWYSIDGSTRPMLRMEYSTKVRNAHQLQLMSKDVTALAADYTIQNTIDASGTSNKFDVWRTDGTSASGGFVPVTTFTGMLNGQNNTINNFYIRRTTSALDDVGLLGYANGSGVVIQNLTLDSPLVYGYKRVGAIAGKLQSGTMSNVSITGSGTVYAELDDQSNTSVGGLVGYLDSAYVSNSSNAASISANNDILGMGGVIGTSVDSSIYDSYNTGSVSGIRSSIGGVVGYQSGKYSSATYSIANSYNTGTIQGNSFTNGVGGIAGWLFGVGGSIYNSYNSGSISIQNNSRLGGIVGGTSGTNANHVSVINSYNTASFTINNSSIYGGLVGFADSYTDISNSYNTGNLSITSNIANVTLGGLVGGLEDGSSISSSFNTGTISSVSTSATNYMGGLIGNDTGNSGTIGSTISDSWNLGSITNTGSNAYVGGIGGGFFLQSTLTTSYNGGTVTGGSGGGGNIVGGLLGYLGGSGEINNSYNMGSVTGGASGTSNTTGGIAGTTAASTTIQRVYTSGPVSMTGDGSIGGLVGINAGTTTNSYSTASVAAGSNTGGVGGFVGRNDGSISNSFSTGLVTSGSPATTAGFVGSTLNNLTSITDSFWDTASSGQSTGVNNTGSGTVTNLTGSTFATTLTTQTTFTNVGWLFGSNDSNPWGIIPNKSYPYLTTIFTSTPRAISGISNSPTTGATVTLANNGSNLASNALTQKTAQTGNNGFYYFLEGNSVFATNDVLLAYLPSGSNAGSAIIFVPSSTDSIINLTLNSNQILVGDNNNNSFSHTTLQTAAGSLGVANTLFAVSGSAPNADLTLGSASNPSVTLATTANTTFTINGSIGLGSGATANILSFSGPVTVNNNGNPISSTGAQTYSSTVTLTSDGSFSGDAISFQDITGGGNSLTINNSGISSIAGISDTGTSFTKQGPGTLTLSGANTFTGGTTINGGTLSISSLADSGTSNLGPSGTLTLDNGILSYTGATTSTNRSVVLNTNGGTFDVTSAAANLTLAGVVSGAGGITKTNIGRLSLTNSNSFGGSGKVISIQDGELTGTSNASFGNGSNTITLTNATLGFLTDGDTLSSGHTITLNNGTINPHGIGFHVAPKITGSTLTISGGGQVYVENSTNDYTGVTTIASGNTFQANVNNALGATGASNETTVNGSLLFNNVGGLNYSAAETVQLNNSGLLWIPQPGTVTFGGNLIFSGTSTIQTDGNLAVSGALTGTGGFNKTSNGILSLASNSSTYSGATTISGGTLQASGSTDNTLSNASAISVSSGATLDLNGRNNTIASLAGAGDVTLGAGILTTGDSSDTTHSGVISGTGGLIKQGTGTFTLSGNNIYSSGTVLSAGTLIGGHASAFGTGTLSLNGGTLESNATLTFGNAFSVNNNPTIGGTNDVTFSNTGTFNPGSTLTISNSGAKTFGILTTLSNGEGTITGNSGAGLITFGGTVGSGNRLNSINISGSTAINGGVVSTTNNQSYQSAVTLGADDNLSSSAGSINFAGTIDGPHALTLTSTSGSVTFGNAVGNGTSLTSLAVTGSTNLNGGIVNTTTTQAYHSQATLGDNTVLTGTDISFDSLINGAGYSLTINTSGNSTISGALSGAGTSLLKQGSGILLLSSANLYTGGTTISTNGGILRLSNTGDLGTPTGATLATINSGGTLLLNNGSNVVIGSGKNLILNGTGAGGIGALSLVTNASATLSGAGIITLNSSDVSFGGTNSSINISAQLTGAGGLTQSGVGSLIVLSSVSNNYTGTLTISAASAQMNANSGTLPDSSAVALTNPNALLLVGIETIGSLSGNGILDVGTALTVNQSTANTFSGVISGNGSLTKDGNATLTLSGANTYSGNTLISTGILAAGANDTLPSGSGKGNVTVDSTLDLNGFNLAINGLSGAGIIDNFNVGTSTLTVGNNDQSSSFSGAIQNTTGVMNVTKAGTGTLNLTGNNTYSGLTTVAAGTLRASHANALGNISGGTIVSSGATLEINGVAIGNEALTLSGTGVGSNGALIGTGTSSLSGGITLGSATSIKTSTAGDTLNLSSISGNSGLSLGGLGSMSLNGDVNVNSITSNASSLDINTNNIITSGSQTYNSPINLGAASSILLNSTGSGMSFDTIDGAADLTLASAGTTTFSGAVGGNQALNSLTTFASNTIINGGQVNTLGNQTYNNEVSLGADTTLQMSGSGSDMTLNKISGSGRKLNLVGSSGNDAFTLNNSIALKSLSVNGTSGDDTLSVQTNAPQSWSINSSNQGSIGGIINGNFGFSNIQNITGGPKNNTFTFANNARISGMLNGGNAAASNTIDISAYIAALKVYLTNTHDGSITNNGASVANFTRISNINANSSGIIQTSSKAYAIYINGTGKGYINDPLNFNGFNTFIGGGNTSVFFMTNASLNQNAGYALVNGSFLYFTNIASFYGLFFLPDSSIIQAVTPSIANNYNMTSISNTPQIWFNVSNDISNMFAQEAAIDLELQNISINLNCGG